MIKNMAKNKIVIEILKRISEGVSDLIDLEEAILKAGYGASMGKIDREFEKIKNKRLISKKEEITIKEKHRRLQKYLWKLKKDGLIKEKKGKVSITFRGKTKLSDEKEYKKEKNRNSIIVSFDIPRAYNNKRVIFIDSLKRLDFKMLHQSTWIGENKIPKEFITDLEKMNILKFIEIFEVTKQGSV